MKTILLGVIVLIGFSAFAQGSADEAQLNKLADELVESFNSHDFSTLQNNSTQDLNWINIVGMWWKGRDMVVGAHYGIFNTIFNGVKFKKLSSSIRFVTEEVAIVNLVTNVGEFYPPDGVDHGNNKMEPADNILTLVYVRREGKWLLTAAQNTVVDAKAKAPKL